MGLDAGLQREADAQAIAYTSKVRVSNTNLTF